MSNTDFTPEDRAFLRRILDHPEERMTWLAYADWLDERGYAQRAEYLRLTVECGELPTGNPDRSQREARLTALQVELDPNWAMMFDTPQIGNCRVRWEFACPLSWENLAATDTPEIRFCLACRRPVFYCHSMGDAEQFASAGECVAITSRVFPASDVPFAEHELIMGMMEFTPDPEDEDGPVDEE
jgi:uncharacterized protein (TIGR02996 family)